MIWRSIYQLALAMLLVTSIGGLAALLIAESEPLGTELLLPQEGVGDALPFTSLTPLATPGGNEGRATNNNAFGERININTASAEQMAAGLAGVGPVLAQRIVDYRDANGPFVRPDQIMGVSGIGPSTYEKLRDHIKVSDP